MAFDEVQFPTEISFGSAGGPGFNTTIIETDSGAEERVSRWATARRQYDSVFGVRGVDDMTSLREFWIARQGAARGFRFKDFDDFTTGANDRETPTDTDEVLGTGDASRTAFQLLKTYTSGLITSTRNITKPVIGTVIVSLDDVSQSAGFTVDSTTGVVTFTSPPGVAVVVKAGCEFDVPVRFGEELEDAFAPIREGFDIATLPSIPLIEIRDELDVPERFYFGGAIEITMVADLTLSETTARVYVLDPQTSAPNLKAICPDKTLHQPGGPHFYVKNDSGVHPFDLVDDDGSTVISTIIVGQFATVLLSDDGGGTRTWRAIVF